jgi:hypothetical protein
MTYNSAAYQINIHVSSFKEFAEKENEEVSEM